MRPSCPDEDRRAFLRAGAACALLGTVPVAAETRRAAQWDDANAIARSIALPQIPARRRDVTEFGARGDGTTPATTAINRAIAACAESGGGRVVVPRGRFLTGALRLRSHVELHLERGAVLAFSADPADYPLVATRWEGVELMNHSPLIYADNENDVAITGAGVIDGRGSNARWWSWSSGERFGWRAGMPDQRPARARLFAMGEAGVPVDRRIFGMGHFLRPPMVQFQRCDRVLVEGVTLRDAPFWNLHPLLCRTSSCAG